MLEENKTVELQDEDTEKVAGGSLAPGQSIGKRRVYKHLNKNNNYAYLFDMSTNQVLNDPSETLVKCCIGMLNINCVLLGPQTTMRLETFRRDYDYKKPIMMLCHLEEDD